MKSKPFGALFGLLALVAILGVAPAFGQTANEIDIATGAGGSANAACVATNNCFTPNPLTVAPGTTVTWKNTDTAMHVVCSGKPSDDECGKVFEEDSLKPGKTFQFTFADAGTYDYYCSVHPWMTGQVIVSGNVSNTSPPLPSTLSVTTDRPSYNLGDTIILTGHVTNMQDSKAITLKIVNSDQNIVSLVQVVPSSDGSFTQTFSTTGTLWSHAGTYSIVAQYGIDVEATGTFYFNGETTTTPYGQARNEIDIATGAGASANAACVSTNNCFYPNPLTVSPGTTVTWRNTDTAMHVICSGYASDPQCGTVFEDDSLRPGSTFQFTFTNSGTYNYFCSVHPWMTGQVIVSGNLPYSPPPQPYTLSVTTDKLSYNQGDMVTTTATLGGTSSSQNIAISVIDPSGNIMISRVLSTSYQGISSIQFKIPATSQIGTYQVIATSSSSGNNLKQTSQFTVSSQYAVSIVSVQSTDQQGNPIHSFARGETGYVKVVLLGQSNQNGLTTINLFDSDSASIGIGSLKGSISNGQSEIVLSFSIPKDAAVGTANIYADVFSDYPSRGGTPLTSEISSTVEIQ